MPSAADDHLQADQLQRDIGHGRDDAGDGHRQRQPAVAEAAAHEIRRRDVVVLVADVPEPRKHQEQDRIDHDRVGHGEERDGAGAEGQRRHGDEGVGGVEIAADQEPGDDGAEAPAAEAPFVQLVEVALAPVRGGEAEPGDEAEQQRRRRSAQSSSRPARRSSPAFLRLTGTFVQSRQCERRLWARPHALFGKTGSALPGSCSSAYARWRSRRSRSEWRR